MSIMGMIESPCFLFPLPICSGASRQGKPATSACLVGQAPFWTIGSFALRCAPETSGDFRRRKRLRAATKLAENSRVLDLLAEDDRLNVYAGKLEVRPPLRTGW